MKYLIINENDLDDNLFDDGIDDNVNSFEEIVEWICMYNEEDDYMNNVLDKLEKGKSSEFVIVDEYLIFII